MVEGVDEEEVFVKETKLLDGISIKDRDEYVKGVLTAFTEVISKLSKTKGKINQLKAWQRMSKEMDTVNEDGVKKGEEIMVCGLYAVKKDYRVLFIEMLRVVTGIEETVNTKG